MSAQWVGRVAASVVALACAEDVLDVLLGPGPKCGEGLAQGLAGFSGTTSNLYSEEGGRRFYGCWLPTECQPRGDLVFK